MPQWIWQRADWPNFRWDDSAVLPVLAQARLRQGRLLGYAKLLDSNLSREAQAQILVEESVGTSAIEGEKLDLDSVRFSVARHLGLATAGLPVPTRNVDGLIKLLLDATTRYDQPLIFERLCGWQAALFPTGYSGLHPILTGQLRGDDPMRVVSGPVGREKIHFEAPPRNGLEARSDEFLQWFNQSRSKPAEDGLLRAGIAHLWFVPLHPFEDGNGRLARAITDMALCQDEQQPLRLFSLSAQIMREREAYYDILEHTQHGDLDITGWLCWFLAQVVNACEQADTTIHRVLAKARFWLRHQITNINERQRKVMNRLLDAGPSGFEGGMNTRKYVSLTKASRATAYRELADLVEKGCLIAVGEGRGAGYIVRWEG
ncbi:MAG: Fic family protein [Sulfuricella sp.]